MEFILEKSDYGYMEIILSCSCEWAKFYSYAEKVGKILQISYIKKVHDYDSTYWQFEFDNSELIISYSTLLGINIYPAKGIKASLADNEILNKIYDALNAKQSAFADQSILLSFIINLKQRLSEIYQIIKGPGI